MRACQQHGVPRVIGLVQTEEEKAGWLAAAEADVLAFRPPGGDAGGGRVVSLPAGSGPSTFAFAAPWGDGGGQGGKGGCSDALAARLVADVEQKLH